MLNSPIAQHPRNVLKLVTAPAAIVSTADAKKHLGVTTSADDTYIDSLIATATAWLDGKDGWLGRALGAQTWDYVLDAFPCGSAKYGGIRVPLPPLVSVTSVKYLDPTTELEVTVAAGDYTVDTYNEPGWIIPDASWPTPLDTVNAVRVRFIAGYATIPAPIKHAILLTIGGWYKTMFGANQFLSSDKVEGIGERRYVLSEQATAMIDSAASSLLEGYRMYSV